MDIQTPGRSWVERVRFRVVRRAPVSSGPEPDVGVMSGGHAVFGVTGRGTRTLAVGSTARAFAIIARRFGGEATYLESSPSAVAEQVPSPIPIAAWRPAIPLPFPFENACFDTVFIGSGLESSAGGEPTEGGVRSAQERLLGECRRVLRPGGTLLAAVENRFGITALAGRRHRATGLRWFGLAPRAFESLLPPGSRASARGYRAYSRRGWSGLLRRTGFEARAWWALWPFADGWGRIAPASEPPPGCMVGHPATRKERLIDRVLGLARAIGAAGVLSPNYLIVARRAGAVAGGHAVSTLLDEMLAAEGERTDDVRLVTRFINSGSLWLTAGSTFVKVGLTPDAQASLERHVRAMRALERHPVAAHVPLPARLTECRGVPYLTCPAIRPDPRARITETLLTEVLDALRSRTTPMKLSETVFWRDVFRPEHRARLEAAGGAAILRRLEREAADRKVLAGLIHGDLHLENLLVSGGRAYVVDWDYSETPSPHFLDALEGARALVSARDSRGSQIELEDFASLALARDPRLPLMDRLFEHGDEVSRPDVVACSLLHWLRKGLIETPIPPWLDDKARLWFGLCERALESDC